MGRNHSRKYIFSSMLFLFSLEFSPIFTSLAHTRVAQWRQNNINSMRKESFYSSRTAWFTWLVLLSHYSSIEALNENGHTLKNSIRWGKFDVPFSEKKIESDVEVWRDFLPSSKWTVERMLWGSNAQFKRALKCHSIWDTQSGLFFSESLLLMISKRLSDENSELCAHSWQRRRMWQKTTALDSRLKDHRDDRAHLREEKIIPALNFSRSWCVRLVIHNSVLIEISNEIKIVHKFSCIFLAHPSQFSASDDFNHVRLIFIFLAVFCYFLCSYDHHLTSTHTQWQAATAAREKPKFSVKISMNENVGLFHWVCEKIHSWLLTAECDLFVVYFEFS